MMGKTREKSASGKLFIAIFLISQLILAIFASSTAIAASIKYDDSYTYEGSTSSDGIAWGGSTLKTALKSYPSNTMVTCLDYCNDGTLESCYGSTFKWPWESKSPLDKCKADSSILRNICKAGKCYNGGVGDWQSVGTGSAGDRWKCSVWSRYYYGCTGSGSYDYADTNAYPYYITYPRRYDCDGDKTKTYDDLGYFGSSVAVYMKADLSCSGNRVCNQNKDDSSADFGLYGTSKPSEPCSVPDGSHDCDSDSDCFSGSICDCDNAFDCTWDVSSGDKDYCCPSGQKWDGSKCATPCKDNDGDGHKDGSCGGDDCNDGDSGVWQKNSCQVCAKEPSGIGNSCTVGVGACQRTGKYKCDSAGTGVTCDVSPGSPSTETCNGIDDDCDGSVDEGVKNACGGCGPVPSETCGDGKDNNCDDLVDEGCCSEPNPYNCGKTGTCWTKVKCDEAIYCSDEKQGSDWYACVDSARYDPKCVNNRIGCCEPQYPYYCPANNWCFSSDSYCDGRQVYTCTGKSNVCNKKSDVGTCFGDILRCCPSGESWWESDKQCHKSSEPPKCSVPDGSSANCDCDTDSECKKADSSMPYCGEGGSLYDVRTPQGFHACLSSQPEWCGNGKCGSGEDYNSCPNDCVSPSGTLDVYVNRGIIPLQGAKVYVDDSLKGFTDMGGKTLISVSQGKRLVRVNCPDDSFCEERYVEVKERRYANFYCFCKLDSDSDGDGYLDSDELIIGTDPKDSASHLPDNLYFEGLAGCVISPVAFVLKWKKFGGDKDAIIQSTESVVQALNVTSVTSSSVNSNTHALAAALIQADLPAEVIESPKGLTLNSSVLAADYMTGIMAGDGLILIATDNQTGTTALIEVGADCLGVLVGLGYGFGQGAVDEVKGGAEAVKVLVPALAKALWLYHIHREEFNEKLYNGVRELVTAAYEIHRERNAVGWKLVMSIFEKGQRVNVFKEDWIYPNKGAYEKFQYGFYSGYLTGYVFELVLSAIFGPKIVAAFAKGTLIAVKAGVKALENLRLAVVEKLGALGFSEDVVKAVSKLPYFDTIIQTLSAAEVNILGKFTKIDSGWAKRLKEEEALTAIRKYDKVVNVDKLVSEARMEKLLSTNLGRETIKLSDATPELLAKQSMLVEKWGVDEVNKVTKKSFFGSFDPERVDGLRKITNAMPEGLADQFTQTKAAKLLGKKGFGDAIEKVYSSFTKSELDNVVRGIDDFENVGKGAEKILKHRPDLSLPKSTNDFPPPLEIMNDLGKLENVKGVDKLAHDIALVEGGHSHAARRAVILKETTNVKLIEIGKRVPVKIKYEGREFEEILDMDIFYEKKVGNKVTKVIEEVKSAKTGVVGADEELQKGVLKMTKALEMSLADEAKIVTKGTFDIDVTRFIEQNGNKIQLVPGGIK